MNPETAGRHTYSSEQFAPLFAAENRHFWFGSRNRCIAAAVRSLPNFGSIQKVLEVGCGTGVVLAELQRIFPDGHIVGMDLFEEGLTYARKRFNGPLIQGDVMSYDFDCAFDLVGAFDVIEHIDDDLALLNRLRHHLKPGGHLIITVPAHQALWSYFDEVALHRRRYSIAILREKLVSTGFQVDYLTQFMGALFPPMWIKRKLLGEHTARLTQADSDRRQGAAESDLAVHPFLNACFSLALWPEPLCISARLKLPLGTSLLAIAKRPANDLKQSNSHPDADQQPPLEL